VLKKNRKKAKAVADQTFHLASLHTNEISEDAIDIIQRLRDDIMCFIPGEDGHMEPGGIVSSSEANSIDNVLNPKGKSSSRKGGRDRLNSTGDGSAQDGYLHGTGAGAGAGAGADALIPAHRRETVHCLRMVRRIVSVPVPTQLDVLPSAALVLKALDKIFRTYVRGTAVSGQLAGGNTVEIDGSMLSFRHFILNGPYISWRGFVQFLLDFAIASPPPESTRSGRVFLSDVLLGQRAGSLAAAAASTLGGAAVSAADLDAVTSPLTMLEAAVVFIESSKSVTPALVLSKFLKIYEEFAEAAEVDPWVCVGYWAEDPHRGDWDIKSGVNFMQFVDCLGVRLPLLLLVIVVDIDCLCLFFLLAGAAASVSFG
jgi:hypothetical protein